MAEVGILPEPNGSINMKTLITGHTSTIHVGNNTTIVREPDSLLRHREKVLDWLSPLHPREDHEQVRGKAAISRQSNDRHCGHTAGKWLLDSDVFDQWRSHELRKLWYIGMPGAGKSVLASIIIHHLQETLAGLKPGRDSGRLAYLYLKYDLPQKIEHLIGSIVRQIIREDPLPQPLVDLWTRCNDGYDVPSEDELTALLRDVTRDGPAYIVIDALDECAVQYRIRFLEALGVNDGNVNFLITSRYLDVFEDVASGFTKRQIQANHDDLDLFIDYNIRTVPRLRRALEHDDDLRLEVKHQVRDRCNGMFLLASLHMRSLATALNKGKIKELLSKLPTEVDDAYMLTLTRIEGMESDMRKLAFDTLCWIIYAQRQLKIRELQFALAADPDNGVFDRDRIPEAEDLRDLCNGLVTVVDDKVALVHYTAQSFLNDHLKNKVPDFDAVIAQTCVNHLSINALELNVPPWTSVYEHPFLQYAENFLDYHLQQLSESHGSFYAVFESLKNLLMDPRMRNSFRHSMTQTKGYREHSPGLDSLSEFKTYENSDEDLDSEDDEDLRRRRRRFSSNFDKDEEEDFLPVSNKGKEAEHFPPLSRENEDQAQDQDKGEDSRPLSTSSSPIVAETFARGKHQTIEDDNSNFPSHCNRPEAFSALHLAAFLGWAPIVIHLADTSLNVNVQDFLGRTPLAIAVQARSWTAVPILLDRGACIDLSTSQGHAILLHCAQRGKRSVVKDLISEKPRPLPGRCSEVTHSVFAHLDSIFVVMVLWNIGTNFLRLVLALLHEVSVCLRLNQQRSPGTTARDEGFNKEGQDSTPKHDWSLRLLRAAESGQHETVNVLMLNYRASYESGDSAMFIRTALFLATEYGELETVRVLLQHGPEGSVRMRGLNGATLLHRAAWRNDVDLVRLLLDNSAGPNVRCKFGHTPWSQNVRPEYKQVLQALVKGGANPNKRGHEGMSVLYVDACRGALEEVKFSLEAGVDPSIRTIYGWTPLHWAANNGHFHCVRELLAAKAEHSPISDVGITPLDMVQGKPHLMAIESILRDAGALTMREILDKETSELQTSVRVDGTEIQALSVDPSFNDAC